jgi:NAD(P)-dependent dehydrogenase (short-subunit alcohol dehydrogenase family)
MNLNERVAVVSGGASGIGAACAERLRDEGCVVVTWDLTGGDLTVDVSDPASVDSALDRTLAEYGVPTLHVAAAGIRGRSMSFHEIEVEDFDSLLAVNLRGVFLTMRAVTGAMVDAGVGGAVVAISSVNGQTADPTHAVYSATKAGVNHMCRIAACDLGAAGIRVNAVAPGPTATPMLPEATEDDDYVAELEATTPLCRVGTPELVADAVVGVLRADWVTGQVIAADGGAALSTARGRWRLPNAARSPHAAPVSVR